MAKQPAVQAAASKALIIGGNPGLIPEKFSVLRDRTWQKIKAQITQQGKTKKFLFIGALNIRKYERELFEQFA